MPDLDFQVVGADVVTFAAAPTMRFQVRAQNKVEGERVQSILLRIQIRIDTMWRHYDVATEKRLLELFGEPHRWGETLRSMLWTHATALVPTFVGETIADVPIACTYDFDVASSKYFHALEDGEVPLLFLFSGTVFYEGSGGAPQILQIPWEKEARFRLPIDVWKAMMNAYFPNSAWVRLRKDVFDRLYQYKVERAFPTWDAALDALLERREAELER